MQQANNSPIDNALKQGNRLTTKNGTATNIVDELTFNPYCSALRLLNLSLTEILKYSIDGGVNYLSILPMGTLERSYHVHQLFIKAENDCEYDLEYTEMWSEIQTQ